MRASWRGHSGQLPEAGISRLRQSSGQRRRWLKILFANVGNSPTSDLRLFNLGLKGLFWILIPWIEYILWSLDCSQLSDEGVPNLRLALDLRRIIGLPRTWVILGLLSYVLGVYHVLRLVENVAYYRFLCKLLVIHFNFFTGIIFWIWVLMLLKGFYYRIKSTGKVKALIINLINR